MTVDTQKARQAAGTRAQLVAVGRRLDGRVRFLVIELPVAGTFLALGTVALWADSPLLLAAGYAAHGLWDLVHHPGAVTTPVRSWYPPFCVVFDVVLAVFIVAWLPLGGLS